MVGGYSGNLTLNKRIFTEKDFSSPTSYPTLYSQKENPVATDYPTFLEEKTSWSMLLLRIKILLR
jgi:hypothetical protein